MLANATGEGIGLGGSLLVGVGIVSLLGAQLDPWVDIGVALVAVALGTFFEGVVVGYAQWRVLRDPLPAMSWGSWVWATAIGAGIAWLLGMLASTVISLVTGPADTAEAGAAAPAEPAPVVFYLAAAALGLVLGPILASAQVVVLRRYVAHSWWWIPANAVAWALALPLTYLGPSIMADLGVSVLGVGILLASVVAAGAIVGAVHGSVLIRLLREPIATAGHG
ncbi:hypothetical protein GCM10009747_15490 [Agromyces humatus]|uniref:Uncharacterized protein n=1 Tax=Agromyces humatus TaxID=279573 RepID=A0ABN2KJD8_9MICO